MIERKCINCGKVFGQSLDDGADGNDTGYGFCEACRGELPNVNSEVKLSAIIPNLQATAAAIGQRQAETPNCQRQKARVEPQGDKEFLADNYRDGVFNAIQRYQQRRKSPTLRKDPTRHRTGPTFSILARESIAYKRFLGIFSANQSESNAGNTRTGQGRSF